mmetsp:Transcript_89991/g.226356  ORF Transcript_89991/g.226356 Transcript_89991/m.226356 type:complete len:545 (-) Transcript_89991:211-1845(-)
MAMAASEQLAFITASGVAGSNKSFRLHSAAASVVAAPSAHARALPSARAWHSSTLRCTVAIAVAGVNLKLPRGMRSRRRPVRSRLLRLAGAESSTQMSTSRGSSSTDPSIDGELQQSTGSAVTHDNSAGGWKSKADARRALRAAQYEQMKRESLTDTSVVGILGAVLAFFNSGQAAATGLIIGSAAGAVYLLLLQADVDRLGDQSGQTPLDMFNPYRILRLFVPLVLVIVLGATDALNSPGGLDAWLSNIHWEFGSNFLGVVSTQALYAGLLGYILSVLALQVRGLSRAVPEVRDLVQAVPGSLGVAAKLTEEAEAKQKAREAARTKKAVKTLPVLLVSGPRGCGKSTLVQRLLESDSRFSQPEWVATGVSDRIATVVGKDDFEGLQKTGSFAVSYRPYADDGEQIDVGLPAATVIAAAKDGGACVLDVDQPTARMLLDYHWDRALAALSPDEEFELSFVSIWVSLPSIDAVIERNRGCLEAAAPNSSKSAIERQLAPLRAQATSDIEWAVTSGRFDFTVLNEDQEVATKEFQDAARYCFGDPF